MPEFYLNSIWKMEKNGLWGRSLRTSFSEKTADTFFSLSGYMFCEYEGYLSAPFALPLLWGLMTCAFFFRIPSLSPFVRIPLWFIIDLPIKIIGAALFILTICLRLCIWVLSAIITVLLCPLLFFTQLIANQISTSYKMLILGLKNTDGITFEDYMKNHHQTLDNYQECAYFERDKNTDKIFIKFKAFPSQKDLIKFSFGMNREENTFSVGIDTLTIKEIYALQQLGLIDKLASRICKIIRKNYQKAFGTEIVKQLLDDHFPIIDDRSKPLPNREKLLLPTDLISEINKFFTLQDRLSVSQVNKKLHREAKRFENDFSDQKQRPIRINRI